jgi:copper oxidase (laccase) domain-containing protein
MAWFGPAIGPGVYEVGSEVAAAFPDESKEDFTARGSQFLMIIYAIARMKLEAAGVGKVFGGELCTFRDPERFDSYRRDRVTGRMAHLIWLEE